MAKINILFDGTDYLVDSSMLESASAALKSHLSINMNGSGATINLGGTAYSVDSAKLTSARNAFVAHLGTIAGTGSKVKIGGAEYDIDTAKTADAVAELHEVLGDLRPIVPIPAGATYTIAATGVTLNSGDPFPITVEANDIYTFDQYKYIYTVESSGWRVALNVSRDYSSFKPILESINDVLVTDMTNTFNACRYMKTCPAIPASVTNMTNTFYCCSSLEVAPVIPQGVTNMSGTFLNCQNLKTYEGATEDTLEGDFSGFVIPQGVTNMSGTFRSCTALQRAPAIIPASVTNMGTTFWQCTALEIGPSIIPNGVTSMIQTFYYCTSLISMPAVIPSSVIQMYGTFMDCTALNGEIVVNAILDTSVFTNYCYCFTNVDMRNITLTGADVRTLNSIGATGNNWTYIK